jgi:hypothetical protein
MNMNYYLKSSLVLGVLGTLVYCEVQGENQPHADYVALSTSNALLATGGPVSNVSPSTSTLTYHASPVTLEEILPHDRLVIQNTALTPPTVTLASSVPATGANPFFRPRQRVARQVVQFPKVPPFWCSSFQKFRARMVT